MSLLKRSLKLIKKADSINKPVEIISLNDYMKLTLSEKKGRKFIVDDIT